MKRRINKLALWQILAGILALLVVGLFCEAHGADISIDVDTAVTVHCNKVPIVASADGYTIDETIAYNESGMDLNWNFQTTAGVITQTNITPTSSGDYDWTHVGNGIYKIEITATGGASANNDTEGYGWISGKADAICPFSGPIIEFRAAGINNVLVDGAYSATRGFAGTALPDAAADAAGGLPISDAGGLALDDIPITAEFEARTIAAASYFDPAADTVVNVTNVATLTGHTAQTGDTYAALPTNFSDLSITVTAGLVSLAADQSGVTIGTCTTNTDMRGTDNAALVATALSSATWTAARAGFIDELAAANIPTDLATINTIVDSILADTGTDGVKVSSLSASAVDAIIDEIIEDTLTMRQILRILLAKDTGLTSGSGTATIKFRDLADTKYRIEGTITDGNRTSVTLDGS